MQIPFYPTGYLYDFKELCLVVVFCRSFHYELSAPQGTLFDYIQVILYSLILLFLKCCLKQAENWEYVQHSNIMEPKQWAINCYLTQWCPVSNMWLLLVRERIFLNLRFLGLCFDCYETSLEEKQLFHNTIKCFEIGENVLFFKRLQGKKFGEEMYKTVQQTTSFTSPFHPQKKRQTLFRKTSDGQQETGEEFFPMNRLIHLSVVRNIWKISCLGEIR